MANPRLPVEQRLEGIRRGWPEVGGRIHAEVLYLYRLRDLLFEDLERVLQPLGLLPTDLDVLAVLRAAPRPHASTPTALYRALLLSSGGLTKVLHRLADLGLVSRPDNPLDRRSRLVQLTPAGERLLAEAAERVLQHERQMLGGLEPAEQAQLQHLLGKLLRPLEGE